MSARAVLYTFVVAVLSVGVAIALAAAVTSGVRGPTGADGAQGVTGPEGAAGASGTPGPEGAAGPSGPIGARGAAGTTGTTGVAGPRGATGATGAAGPIGPPGPQGEIGEMGSPGARGAAGAIGPAGPQGAPGGDGPEGAAGPGAVVAGRSTTESTATVTIPAGIWRVSAWMTVQTNDQALISCTLLVPGQTPIEFSRLLQPPTTTSTYTANSVVVLAGTTDVTATCAADRADGIKEPTSVIAATQITGP